MPGGRSGGFWDSFSDDNERSELDTYVVMGNIPIEFQDLYYDTVMSSPEYENFSPGEKSYMAELFMQNFYYGGVSASDQEEFFALLGLYLEDFDWDEYVTLYDAYR